MGPTEFRIIMIIINTLFALIRPLREFSHSFTLCGHSFTLGALDYIAALIIVILALMHLTTVRKDIKDYAKMDPMPRRD
jgi:membrane protein insertase Oxa1/YidC/SpoIIIJ